MRTGADRADLRELLDLPEAPSYLPELMAAKAEAEHAPLAGPSIERLTEDVIKLQSVLDDAEAVSELPDRPTADAALHDLLVRVRLSV
ncbi:hypothetical protein [Kribbella pittospori]|uniref:hypothetical protein n=1 Tax=Kribbella pittospori TaxID=722689 RepID=UPI00192D925C|nr:hypothetical protein [Kribbella pittospori]